MWFSKTPKKALVTVMTSSFLPGTMVMLHSFVRHNPWFSGDIVIIHDQSLSEREQNVISSLFSVKWLLVDQALHAKVKELCKYFPDFERRLGQFYSLETFRLAEYERILFMDSDTFFKGSIEPLFHADFPLQVCMKSGKFRQPESVSNKNPFSIEQFNAGMMLINRSILKLNLYHQMIDKVEHTFFQGFLEKDEKGQWIPAQLTADQLILNTLLLDKAHYVPMKYNYRLGIADVIQEKEGLAYEDAVVVHFTGRKKPWLLSETIQRIAQHPNEKAAYMDWHGVYVKIIEAIKRHH